MAASCLSVCVRANELEEPPLEELQHLKSESKRRLAAQESGRFARNIRKIVCEEESTPKWNYGLPRKTSIVRVYPLVCNAASGGEKIKSSEECTSRGFAVAEPVLAVRR